MRADQSVVVALFFAVSSAVCALAPPLGVSRVPIPGEFLEYRDIDGDGIRDVIYAEVGSAGSGGSIRNIGYMLGRPGFTFAEPFTFSLTPSLDSWRNQTVAIVDDSGEPTAVIALGTRVEGYRVVEGQLIRVFNETFAPQHNQSYDASKGLRAGDLDGDGLDDFLLYGPNGFIIRWSARQPFTRYQSFPIGSAAQTLPIKDYDGDGLLDVVVRSTQTGELLVYPGTGTDKLAAPIHTGIFFTGSAVLHWNLEMSTGNFDSHPGLDLVYSNGIESVVLGLNFATPDHSRVVLPPPVPMRGAPWVIGNLKGERDTIVYPASGPAIISSWTNPDAVWIDPLGADAEVLVTKLHMRWGTSYYPMANQDCVDTDGDGMKEIVSFSYGQIMVQHMRDCAPEGLPPIGPSLGTASASVLHTLAVDLDGDGLPELFNTGGVPMILNPRDLSGPPITLSGLTPSGFMSVQYAPVEDGVVRVAMGSNPLRIISFGTDGLPTSIDQYASPDDGSYLGLITGDFDGDGLEDLAAVQGGWLQMFRSVGDGTIEWFAQLLASNWIKPAAADLNGDGLTDLIVSDTTANTITILLNQGGGVFEPVQTWSSTAGYWLIVEDLDGDGLPDLAGVNGSSASATDEISIAVWFGVPGGLFGEQRILRVGGRHTEIMAVDLDHDGLKDLVVSGTLGSTGPMNSNEDESRVYTQVSPRQYQYSGQLPGVVTVGVAAADLNGDGAIDVVTVSGDARTTYIHWGFAPPCQADTNCDGLVNFFDLSTFMRAFGEQQPSADIAEPFGVWNFFDVSTFVQLFNQGCP